MELITNQVYEEFVTLCNESECFYFVDQEMSGKRYRIFGYRLSSYSDWLKHPLSLWLRGLMIEIDQNDDFVKVASRPFMKFFNVTENPLVAHLSFEDGVKYRLDSKEDGSLMSSYLDADGKVRLKSKMSLHSEQAVAGTALLYSDEYSEFCECVRRLAEQGYTVDCEYVSLTNRVVLSYNKPQLFVLAVRCNDSGIEIDVPELVPWYAKRIEADKSFIENIPNMTGIEGFVIHHPSGVRLKMKTTEYLNLHHAKDGIGQPKKIAKVILDDTVDDIKTLFATDVVLLGLIERMESAVKEAYNHLVAQVEDFWNQHKELDRKSYAIKAQADLPGKMSLAMNLFLGREAGYKDFFMKNFDSFLPDVNWYNVSGTTT